MAYSRDFPKMASVALWIEIAVILNWRYGVVWFGMVWYGFGGIVWYGFSMITSEFIHEEILTMVYNGLS